ncbi:hypothetical protein HY312_00395 [Candidatus Saccharibacteria bacterium]|nr:hypothetical protein [Candidatus Saccharibacteria bacterium]
MDRKVKISLIRLVNEDAYLLANNINERTIMHRFAMYYAEQYPKWDVDCEFNTNLGQPKALDFDPIIFIRRMSEIIESDHRVNDRHQIATFLRDNEINHDDIELLAQQLHEIDGVLYDDEFDALLVVLRENNGKIFTKSIYPDVIVHKRGTSNNHIVIEAKKSLNFGKIARAFDLVKLYTLVNHPAYRYKQGYFIDLPVNRHFEHHKSFMFIKDRINGHVTKIVSI